MFVIEEFDLYVWEGKVDIVDCVVWCMVSFDVEVICVDNVVVLFECVVLWCLLVIISVMMIEGGVVFLCDWQVNIGMLVVWVGVVCDYDVLQYLFEYLYILLFDFMCVELCGMIGKFVM